MVGGGRVARAIFSLTSSAGMEYACKVRKGAHIRGFHTDLGGGRLTHASFSFTSGLDCTAALDSKIDCSARAR